MRFVNFAEHYLRMIIHQGYRRLGLKNPVVTIGVFDGVHQGHRFLLDTLVSRARETGGESVVITFEPHPRIVLSSNKKNISFLSTPEEKEAMLSSSGIDHLVIIRFTKSFSRMRACDFVEKVLVAETGTRYLIIGHDHHFGYRGEGDYNTIEGCAVSAGFMVEQLAGYSTEEGMISSSAIREALMQGRVEEANRWLGYNYYLKGQVVEGRKIGRVIGFPTANIKPGDKYKLVPADGVYAVETVIDGKVLKGMLSIGKNPTVNRKAVRRSIEVNIFNFSCDIYGKEIEIIFRYRLRDEKKFSSTRELAAQMETDRAMAAHMLK